jgi:hypothetical protein
MPVTATSFGLSLFARHAVSTPYHPSDSWGLEGPLKSIQKTVVDYAFPQTQYFD